MCVTQSIPAEAIRVRMILYDYDAAPDGAGTYVKLDSEFPSSHAALHYKDRCLRGMYWGRLETLDGQLIKSLEEEYE